MFSNYTLDFVEFVGELSFDDASNGAGVFGFGDGDLSGSNVENLMLLIRDGSGGAGESADVFFNFNDGMGGNGVGVVEEMLRQQGATSFF